MEVSRTTVVAILTVFVDSMEGFCVVAFLRRSYAFIQSSLKVQGSSSLWNLAPHVTHIKTQLLTPSRTSILVGE